MRDKQPFLRFLMAVCCTSAGLSPAAIADTFTVTTAGEAGGQYNALCDATCGLREAVLAANANPGTDTIELPAATYALSRTGAGEDAGETGDLDITDDVIIVGADRDTTIIDGQSSDRIIHVLSADGIAGVEVTLRNLTLQNGKVDAANGGALHNTALGTVTLQNVLVTNNSTSNDGTLSGRALGGGIYNLGEMTLQDAVVSDNTAAVNQSGLGQIGGGGIYNGATGTLIAKATTIRGNRTTNSLGNFATGGGILNLGTLLISENSVVGGASGNGNISFSGGGISNFGGFATISQTDISYNIAERQEADSDRTGAAGGGVFSTNSGNNTGNLLITRSDIHHNSSNGQGGGVANSGSPLTITHSAIRENTVRFLGGGVSNIGNTTVEITNTTIAKNQAVDALTNAVTEGGGMYTSSRLLITSVTIADNVAGSGAQVFVENNAATNPASIEPQVSFTNTIIANGASASADNNCGGAVEFIVSQNFNIDSGSTCQHTDEETDTSTGIGSNDSFSDQINTDPLLANNLDRTDSDTPYLVLPPNSPAVDKRILSGCPARDQRFYVRNNLCDIGAYESDALPGAADLADLKLTMTDAPDPAVVNRQIVYTLNIINIGPDTAQGVTLEDTLPAEGIASEIRYNFFTGTGNCSTTDNILRCDLGNMAAFDKAELSITVEPTAATTLTNSASVRSAIADSDYFTNNNTVTVTTEVQAGGSDITVPGFSSGGGGGVFSAWLLMTLLPAVRLRRGCARPTTLRHVFRRPGAGKPTRRAALRRPPVVSPGLGRACPLPP